MKDNKDGYHIDESELAFRTGRTLFIGIFALGLAIVGITLAIIVAALQPREPLYRMSEDKRYVYNQETGEVYRIIKDWSVTLQEILGD